MHEVPTASSEDLHVMRPAVWILAILGALAIIAGIVVLAQPSDSLATLAVVTGVFVLVDGIAAIIDAVVGSRENRGLVAILGVVSVVIGILLIRHPIGGVKAVALFLGLWLIAAAVVRLVAAFAVPGHRLRRLLGAVILAIAGIAIVSEPHIGYATLAVITGIGFIGYGASLIALGWALRTVEHTAARAAAPHQPATT
jgi:uncharacterized membrane protein HdeD (DUF308 family)